MDTDNDGIIDDPLVKRKKMGRPYSNVPLAERKKMYNERHKAWSKQRTQERKRKSLERLLLEIGVNPYEIDNELMQSVVEDSKLVLYWNR